MSKKIGPKCKQCRRENTKLMLKGDRCQSSKCGMVKRACPPGVHGIKGPARLTEYGIQLREKQKAKRFYGLLERQFSNYYQKAVKHKGNTVDNFLQLLELRFDSVIYYLGFASSRSQARELINHKHFLINGKSVNIPSYQLSVGDKVELKEKSKNSKFFQEVVKDIAKKNVTEWLNLDPKTLEGKVLELPTRDKLKLVFNPKLIIEFYSR